MIVQNTPGGAIRIVQGSTSQVIAAGLAQTSSGAFVPPSGTGFIHITAGAMDGAARNPLASEVPGFDNVTVTGVPTAGQVPVASSGVAAAWGTITIGPSTFTPGTAGQVLVTNSVPETAWTSLISYETVHGRFTAGGQGSDHFAMIGPDVGAETSASALWLLAHGVAASATNFAAQSNGTNLILNTTSSDSFLWYTGGSTQIAIMDAHGRFKAGGSSTDWYASIGPDDTNPNVEAAVWLLPPATARSGTNMSLLNNGTGTYMNSQGGLLSFSVNSFGTNLAWMQAATQSFYLWGMPNFTWNVGGGAPVLSQEARVSDAVPGDFTIRAQYAYTSATGANRKPGNIVLDIGAPTNAGTTEAFFSFTRNASEGARLGSLAPGSFQWGLWLGSGAAFSATMSNAALITDANTFTYVNTTSTGSFGVTSADATFIVYVPTTQNKWLFGSSAATILAVDWTTSTTPVIQGGTSATQLTVGTNKASASLVLQGDAATSCLTLTTKVAVNVANMQWDASLSPLINQAQASGAPNDFNITAQAAGGAGTNDGGNLLLNGGAHAGASKQDGSVHITTPFNAGHLTKNITGNVTLNNVESNNNAFLFTGALAGPATVTWTRKIADTSWIFVRNTTGQTLTIAYLTGGTVTVANNTSAFIDSDTANLQKIIVGT